jgi:hypothetical protein
MPCPPTELFSDRGFVVDDIAIGFLFTHNAKSCHVDHVIADPSACDSDRKNAVDELFNHIEHVASDEGYSLITMLAKIPAMKKRAERLGYSRFDDFTLYFKVPKGR